MLRKSLLIFLSILIPTTSLCAASTKRRVIYEATAVTADAFSAITCFGPGESGFAFYAKIIFNSGTSTADVSVEYAPLCTPAEFGATCSGLADNEWFTLEAFTLKIY